MFSIYNLFVKQLIGSFNYLDYRKRFFIIRCQKPIYAMPCMHSHGGVDITLFFLEIV